jgi:hypothetical protein
MSTAAPDPPPRRTENPKRVHKATKSANAWARWMASHVNASMRAGHVELGELWRALAAQGLKPRLGGTWDNHAINDLTARLKTLGLLAVLPRGPYASVAYSSRPRVG